MTIRVRMLALAGTMAVLGGCAQTPVTLPAIPVTRAEPARPSYPPSALSDEQRTQAIRRYRRQADDARKAGDLAAVATSLQIMTLLAPGDDALLRELAGTRSAISSGAKEQLQAGNTALAAGDLEQANAAMLRALALDPQNGDAAKVLREIDRRRLTRIQADRAARVKQDDAPAKGPRTASMLPSEGGSESFDLEQALELLRAGDSSGGLRDLRAFVDANPGNRAARHRISAAVAERARELERQGSHEQALGLYEQALNLRGDNNVQWAAQIGPLRQAVSKDYMDRAARMYRVDLGQTITLLETSVKVDPANAAAAARLKDAKSAQEKLKKIEATGTAKRP